MKKKHTLKTVVALILGALTISTAGLQAQGLVVTDTAEPISGKYFTTTPAAALTDGTQSFVSGPEIEDIIQYSAMAGVPTGSTVFPGFTTSTATTQAALPAGTVGTIQIFGLKTANLNSETAASILADQVFIGQATETLGQDGKTLFGQGVAEDASLQDFVNGAYNAFGVVSSISTPLVGIGIPGASTLQGVIMIPPYTVPEPDTKALALGAIFATFLVVKRRRRA